jgi:hypothetical protein
MLDSALCMGFIYCGTEKNLAITLALLRLRNYGETGRLLKA